MNDVYIASGARTPMGGFQGSLSDLGAVDLGAAAIKEAVSRANLDGSDIEEIIIGCVLPSGLRQGPARQAAIDAGIPVESGATTINKLCGSGMKATMLASLLHTWRCRRQLECSVRGAPLHTHTITHAFPADQNINISIPNDNKSV